MHEVLNKNTDSVRLDLVAANVKHDVDVEMHRNLNLEPSASVSPPFILSNVSTL